MKPSVQKQEFGWDDGGLQLVVAVWVPGMLICDCSKKITLPGITTLPRPYQQFMRKGIELREISNSKTTRSERVQSLADW